jgi:phage N-6-adenine-methyltransferase
MALSKKEIKAFTSSDNQNWETPPYIFNDLHKRFKFTIDGAANSGNSLLEWYWDDALNENWSDSRVFVNPPYGDMVPKFADKCSQSRGLVVALIPARVGTVWFQDYVLSKSLVFFVRGRIRFWLDGIEPMYWCVRSKTWKKKSPLFDSVIAIYNHPRYQVGMGTYTKPTNNNEGELRLFRGANRYSLL